VTKAASGGRAIQRAATQVKPEQASKSIMRMRTRTKHAEGRVNGEIIDTSSPSIPGVVGTARWKSDASNRGRPVAGEGCGGPVLS
jgi:hypothetical protein